MAIDRDFTGFEGIGRDNLTSGDAFVYVTDGTARTGEVYLRLNVPTASINSGKVAWRTPTAAQAIVAGEYARAKKRVFFRLPVALPSGNDVIVAAFGPQSNPTGAIIINSSGNFSTKSGSNLGTYDTGLAAVVGTWYRLELEVRATRLAAAGFTASITVGGSMDVGTHSYKVAVVDSNGAERLLTLGFGTVTAEADGTPPNHQSADVVLTAPPIGCTWNLYRSKAGAPSTWYLVTTGLGAGTYSDAASDASLGAAAPTLPSFTMTGTIDEVYGSIQNESGLELASSDVFFGATANNITAAAIGHFDSNSSTWIADFDDWAWIIEDNGPATLPTGTRVTRVDATSQGASADWSGDWRTVIDVPRDTASATDEQTTSTNAATTTFGHDTAATLGLSGIEAIRIYGALKAASAGNDALLIGATEYTVAVTTSYPSALFPTGLDWSSYTTAAFDAMEFGARNKRGVSLQLGEIYLEVLHAGTNPFATTIAGVDSWKHKCVYYSGNSGYQTISGVGFRPQAVLIVKALGGTGTALGVLKLGAMGGAQSRKLGSAAMSMRAIQKITADGFSLGPDTEVNETGVTYLAICLQDGGQHPTGYFLHVGAYVGNGIDSTNITAEAGWTPDFVLITASTTGRFRDAANVGDQTNLLSAGTAFTDQIQALQAGGFQVGSNAGGINSTSTLYFYVAIRFGTSGRLEPLFAAGGFDPGGSSYDFHGLSFTPEFVAVKKLAATDAYWRSATIHSSTTSKAWSGNSNGTTQITALLADGFSLGSGLAAAGIFDHYFAFTISGSIPLGEVVFGTDDDTSGETIGHTWVELTDAASALHVWSKVALPDPATYYGGYKEDRIISWSAIKRALSGRDGQYEGTSAGFVLSDWDRAIRALYGGLTTKYFKNRPFVERMISDAARRLLDTPRTIVRAIVRAVKPLSPLHFEIQGEDYFAQKFVAGSKETQIPRRVITRADFATCPTTVINKAVPVIYGSVSDEGSSTAPPILTGTTSRGAYYYGQQFAGFGDLTSDAAVPTGVSAVAAAGGTLSANVPNSEYGVIVTAVDASGRESNPAPFYYNGPGDGRGSFAFGAMTGVVVDGTQKLSVSWTASAGAVKYRVYLAWFYYGARFQQWIEVNAPTVSCEFTKGPAWDVYAQTSADITPGASFINYSSGFLYYAVSAVMADGGETARSSLALAGSGPYRRPLRIEWLAVTGATAYRIYRHPMFGDFDHKWEVPATQTYFDDDLLETGATIIDGAPAASGVVPVIYVGTENDSSGVPWHAFLVCGHAVKAITAWYAGGVRVDPGTAGVTWAVPGQSGYATYFPNTGNPQYRDINGNRYTILYVRGPDAEAAISGTRPITVNVQGIENVGDGSGALITDAILQYRHALQNWLIGEYASGAWLASPTFPDDATLAQIDDASFDTAAAIAATRIAGGYIGAFILGADGERISLRDAIARFNVSCDVNSGFNRKTQFFVVMESSDVSLLETGVQVTQVREIFEGTFNVNEVDSDFFNVIPYTYGYNYREKKWTTETELPDQESINNYQEEKRDQTVSLYMIRSATVAADIISRRLVRSSETPRVVVWTMGLAGLSIELGDVVLVTHTDGIGSGGWTNHPVRVIRHEVSPDQFTVAIEADDVERIFGGFILGDETTLAATWLLAGTADRRYGYLGDETTNLFGDGAPIKRLR